MDLGIAGRWALVCGASKGLGYGCARALAGEGVNLVINARTASALAAAAAAAAAMAASDPFMADDPTQWGELGQPGQGPHIGPYPWQHPSTQSRERSHQWLTSLPGRWEAKGGWKRELRIQEIW